MFNANTTIKTIRTLNARCINSNDFSFPVNYGRTTTARKRRDCIHYFIS